ncbi:hypothetical protein [Dethiothermospora halolimnae]|uniref:hypothetical protein n=1 Tax=Dethiothermospora halolimnae TaxID=3114390 RepID=UPI003CCBE876
MKRRIINKNILVTMGILLMTVLISCSSKEVNIKDDIKSPKQELTMAVWSGDMDKGDIDLPIKAYTQLFENENNVKVTYDIIHAVTYEDYIKKLNAKLYTDNGPTLIYKFPNTYIERGVAVDLSGKLLNLEKIYDGLKREKMFYIPIGMSKDGMILNREALKRLEIEKPNLNWTKKDYINIKEKWLKDKPREFNLAEYKEIVRYPLYELNVIDQPNKVININNEKVKNYLHKVKEKIFSRNYILNKDYDYYYKMIFDRYSKERESHIMNYINNPDKLIRFLQIPNILKLKESQIENDKFLILPSVYDHEIKSFGFIVNKKGKNIELALKYINGLLSNESQKNIYYSNSSYYPVNKEIEKDIMRWDKDNGTDKRTMELRNTVLNRLKKEKVNYLGMDNKIKIMYENIEKDLFHLIFTDKEYSDKELEGELKKLEDKYSIIFNE